MSYQNIGGLGGQWFLAILMIVIVGWVVFKYLMPKSWKEWRAAGIIQAFIIALYAEMYGFPLTIYLLTAYFGVDIPWLHMKGHLWSSLLGFGDIGAMVEMILGYGIIFVGIALLAAGWRQIYSAQKKSELETSGLYKYIRHPQYTGIFLGIIGQLIHWPTIITVILAPLIMGLYYRLAIKEEKSMLKKFGKEYDNYMKQTPRFWPLFKKWRMIFRVANN